VDAVAWLLTLPVELEAWLILAYGLLVLAGARLFETLAKVHFERARRYAERGFEYVADLDHYECPQGERLALHLVDDDNRLAVYRAPAASCNGCPSKASCTPHDEGRHLYRSLAEWAETDIGHFHQWLSLLMFAVGGVLSGAGLARWGGQPGTGLLLLALVVNVSFLVWDVRKRMTRREEGRDVRDELKRCLSTDRSRTSC
jgi:hypothetical protein